MKGITVNSRLIFLSLCLAISGFSKYPETPTHDSETGVKKQAARTKTGIWQTRENIPEGPEPWTTRQLMAPADLAAVINDPKQKKPIIICVGPGALIRGSLDMGPAKEKENLEKLKRELNKLPRDANVVIYCGCCPFEHCPNIRPAFNLLNEMKFSNAHLLNLEHNLKTDWLAKGYPQA
jgi:thiosulfate/3-mercaptopyruvate sulfurtransferase